jgi:pimeloyl-ACP methyl ester carboxylesterase
MTEPQGRITSRTETQERRGEPGAGEGARERLLSGLPVTERRLDLNDVSTAVVEGGDGPPVVLLHGPGEHAAKWFQVLPDLVTTHRVVAPDLPGHGASDAIGGTLDADRVLGWLDDLIECTCPTPAVLVGHALGGAIAARYAVDRGERIRNMVLVDALGLTAFQPAPEFALALTEFMSEPTEDAHDRLWSRCAFDLHAMRDRIGEPWAWFKAYNLDRAQAPGLKATREALMVQFAFAAISPADLARIAVPTTLVWGRHDLATRVSVAEAASKRYGWPLRVIEDAGDDPPMEQPEAFLRALRATLGSSDGAGGGI